MRTILDFCWTLTPEDFRQFGLTDWANRLFCGEIHDHVDDALEAIHKAAEAHGEVEHLGQVEDIGSDTTLSEIWNTAMEALKRDHQTEGRLFKSNSGDGRRECSKDSSSSAT